MSVKPLRDSVPSFLAMLGTLLLVVPYVARWGVNLLAPGPTWPYWGLPAALLLQQLLLAGLALLQLRVGLGLSWSEIGLSPADLEVHAQRGIVVGALFLVVNGVAEAIARNVSVWLAGSAQTEAWYQQEQSRVMGLFQTDQPVFLLVLLFVTVAIVTPVAEELFFRGYLYRVLKHWMGRYALLMSSFIFTVLHFYVVQAFGVFVLSVLLHWLYEKRGTLWSNIFAHGTLNGLVAILLVVSKTS